MRRERFSAEMTLTRLDVLIEARSRERKRGGEDEGPVGPKSTAPLVPIATSSAGTRVKDVDNNNVNII